MVKRGKGSVTHMCMRCNAPFSVFLAHIRRGRPALYCSRKCTADARSAKPSKATITTHSCKECHTSFERRKGSGGTKEFCSIRCVSVWRGRMMSGSKHPFWNGGSSERAYVVKRTIRDRKAAIGLCEDCHGDGPLQGHHVENHSSSEHRRADPDNIKVLCVACHAKQHPRLSSFILAGANRGQTLDR